MDNESAYEYKLSLVSISNSPVSSANRSYEWIIPEEYALRIYY